MLLSAPGFAKGGILREGLAGGDAILIVRINAGSNVRE